MVDDHLHEPDLGGRAAGAVEELGQGLLGRLPVQADELPDEQAQPALGGLLDLRR